MELVQQYLEKIDISRFYKIKTEPSSPVFKRTATLSNGVKSVTFIYASMNVEVQSDTDPIYEAGSYYARSFNQVRRSITEIHMRAYLDTDEMLQLLRGHNLRLSLETTEFISEVRVLSSHFEQLPSGSVIVTIRFSSNHLTRKLN